MAKLIWTEPALRQLEDILEFIALDKPDAAKKVATSIFEITDNVKLFKSLGREIPEYPTPHYRQLWIRPCWLYYKVSAGTVYILHVRRGETLFKPESLR